MPPWAQGRWSQKTWPPILSWSVAQHGRWIVSQTSMQLTVNKFDAWRERYPQLSDTEHLEFYNTIAQAHPDQSHVDTECVDAFFNWISPRQEAVLEVGGWDGALAAAILPEHDGIQMWKNVEISHAAASNAVCRDSRYAAESPSLFRWWKYYDTTPYQIFIAAHVLEHLAWADAQDVLRSIQHCRAVYLEIPIMRYHTIRWHGYEGTHILEVSWTTVQKYMERLGFTMTKVSDLTMWGIKGGAA